MPLDIHMENSPTMPIFPVNVGGDVKTTKGYYQIIVYTLLRVKVKPFKKTQSRQIITKAPKYYMFDVGIAGSLTKWHIVGERGAEFGNAFEYFIFMEIIAYRFYSGEDWTINFWRTKSGLEGDFVLDNGKIALKVKGGKEVDKKDLFRLFAFSK